MRRKPAVVRGPADAARHGERAGATTHAVPERGVRLPAQDHPHPALGQTEQNTDSQARRALHRLPLPGAAERRAGLQNGELQLCGARTAELCVFRVEDGGRMVHVNISLTRTDLRLLWRAMVCTPNRMHRIMHYA